MTKCNLDANKKKCSKCEQISRQSKNRTKMLFRYLKARGIWPKCYFVFRNIFLGCSNFVLIWLRSYSPQQCPISSSSSSVRVHFLEIHNSFVHFLIHKRPENLAIQKCNGFQSKIKVHYYYDAHISVSIRLLPFLIIAMPSRAETNRREAEKKQRKKKNKQVGKKNRGIRRSQMRMAIHLCRVDCRLMSLLFHRMTCSVLQASQFGPAVAAVTPASFYNDSSIAHTPLVFSFRLCVFNITTTATTKTIAAVACVYVT